MTITPYTPADLPDILAACDQEGWPAFSARSAEYAPALAGSTTLVARRDGAFAGYLRALTDGSFTAFICELLVTPAHRGQGVGSGLIAALARDCPVPRLELISDADGFYQRQGFRALGTGFRRP